MGTLPGHMIDLIRDGIPPGSTATRSPIVKAIRSVMLSAHRNQVPWATIHTELTDTATNRLAQQLATGRRGQTINRNTRDKFLRKHWEQTLTFAETHPVPTPEQARTFIAHVRDQLASPSTGLDTRQTAVMHAALDLAHKHGTLRPALPSRQVAELAGLPTHQQAHRVMRALAADGTWLALARPGRRGANGSGHAALYWVAPGLADTHMRAKALCPVPPMSAPPMSAPATTGEAAVQLTVTVAPEHRAVLLRYLADLQEASDRAAVTGATPARGGLAPVVDLDAHRQEESG